MILDVVIAMGEWTHHPVSLAKLSNDNLYNLIYVNQAFEQLGGYSKDECLGQTCKFLQGKSTEKAAIEEIRNSLSTRTSYCGDVINYKKSGEIFINTLMLVPLNEEYYIGFQGEHENWKKRQANRKNFELELLAAKIERIFIISEIELREKGEVTQQHLFEIVRLIDQYSFLRKSASFQGYKNQP